MMAKPNRISSIRIGNNIKLSINRECFPPDPDTTPVITLHCPNPSPLVIAITGKQRVARGFQDNEEELQAIRFTIQQIMDEPLQLTANRSASVERDNEMTPPF
jgi:hypothetical protein